MVREATGCRPAACWATETMPPRRPRFDEDEPWPEVAAGLVSGDEGGFAVSISGGGMRSFALACGQMRALIDGRQWDAVRYVSGSSGGAWFALALWCSEGDPRKLLGEIEAASELRLATLGAQVRPGCLRSAAATSIGAEVRKRLVERLWLARRNGFERALEATMNDTLFKPFSGASLRECAKPDRPWTLAGVAALGEWRKVPFDESNRRYRALEASPLAVGAPGTMIDGIGGWQEAMALREEREVTAATLAALAGLAHADFVASHQKKRIAPLQMLARLATTVIAPWPGVGNMVLGDGGIVDNLNLLPLARRRNVRDILALCNFETPLNPCWKPDERDPVYDEVSGCCLDVDASLPSYFGVNVVPDSDRVGYFLKFNHVFEKTALASLITRLQASASTGRGAVGCVDLATLRNDWYAVPAGLCKRLIVVYLGRCPAWEAALADPQLKELLAPADADPTNLLEKNTRFPRFPHLSASGPFAPPFDAAAVDLLASFGGTILSDNLGLIDAILAKPFGFFAPGDNAAAAFFEPPQPKRQTPPQHTIKHVRIVRRQSSLGKIDALIDGR